MKSLSIKKVAAVAVGAAMVGASFAGAVDVDSAGIGSYKWFTNGEPSVKIVVGNNAAVSDAVAAANLAAMIGNLAYSDAEVKADVTGGSTTDGSTTGTVDGKTVTLEVTTPAGTTGMTGTASVSTQLWDSLDYSQSKSETTRADAVTSTSALVGDGTTSGGFKIANLGYPSVAYSGTVSGLGSYSVKQDDTYFIAADSYYDQASKAYLADKLMMTQVINFTVALPQMYDLVNGSYANRESTDRYLTKNNNVKIKFLGQDYVITDMTNTSIRLGKESKFLQMKPGDTVQIGDQTLKLVSISPIGTTSSVLPPASFELTTNGTRVDQFTMDKSTSDYNKNGIILDVRDVFVGAGDASYAEIAVYSAALTLTNGNRISFEGQDSITQQNTDWSTTLTYEDKNVGGYIQKALKTIQLTGPQSSRVSAGGSVNMIANPTFARLTYLGTDTTIATDTLTISAMDRQTYKVSAPDAGDTSISGDNQDMNVTQVKSTYTSAFEVSGSKTVDTLYIDEFRGRIYYKDASSTDANNLTSSGIQGNTVTYAYPSTKLTGAIKLMTSGLRSGPTVVAAANASAVVPFVVGDDLAAGVLAVTAVDSTGSETLPTNNTITVGAGIQVANISAITAYPGALWYNVYYANATGFINYTGNPVLPATAAAISNSAPLVIGGTNLTTPVTTDSLNNVKTAYLRVYEPSFDLQPTNLTGYFQFDLNVSDSRYLLTGAAPATTYNTPFVALVSSMNTIATSSGSWEAGYVSPYGVKLDTLTTSTITLKYPQSIVKAKFQFGGADTTVQNVTSEGVVTTTKPLNELEMYTIGSGYSVKVKAITGSASCTGSTGTTTGSSATCTPSKAAVVTALNTARTPLVYLDNEASASGQWVIIGGPAVNAVAAGTPGAEVVNAAGQSVVRVIGSNVLVAGYSAADTKDAANELINWLASKRDEVRGV